MCKKTIGHEKSGNVIYDESDELLTRNIHMLPVRFTRSVIILIAYEITSL